MKGLRILFDEAASREELFIIGDKQTSRRAQATPIEPYWEWSAASLRDDCEKIGIDRGQLKSQIVKDCLQGLQ